MAGWLDQLFSSPGQGGILGGLPGWMADTGGRKMGWQDDVGQPPAPTEASAARQPGQRRAALAQRSDGEFGRDGSPPNPNASLFGGIGEGIGSLLAAMQANGQGGEQANMRALAQAGAAPAAALNPDILKALAAAMFAAKRQPTQVGVDGPGHDIPGMPDVPAGQSFDPAGRPITANGPHDVRSSPPNGDPAHRAGFDWPMGRGNAVAPRATQPQRRSAAWSKPDAQGWVTLPDGVRIREIPGPK